MPGYRKRYGNRPRGRYAKRQPRWKQIMKLGKDLFPSIRGPLGYAIKGVNLMKNLINTEVKYIDTTVQNGATVTTTSNATPITAVAQGSSDITRNGNSILIKYIVVRWQVFVNATAGDNTLRMIVFIDKDNAKGTAPTNAELFSQNGALGFTNINNTDRFAILRDVQIDVNATGDKMKSGHFYHDCSRLHVKYDGTDATQGSCAENHIYVLFVSDQATNGPTVNCISRVGFYDN